MCEGMFTCSVYDCMPWRSGSACNGVSLQSQDKEKCQITSLENHSGKAYGMTGVLMQVLGDSCTYGMECVPDPKCMGHMATLTTLGTTSNTPSGAKTLSPVPKISTFYLSARFPVSDTKPDPVNSFVYAIAVLLTCTLPAC
jgi:hypothetical protein